MSWLLKLIFALLSEVLIAAVEYLAEIIDNIFDYMYQINLDLNLGTVSNYIVIIATSLTLLFGIKQGIEVYVLHTEGDPEADPLEFITRVAQTVATIMTGQYLVNYLIKLASKISKELLSYVVYNERTLSAIFLDVIAKVLSFGTIVAFIQLVFLCITVVAFILFIFSAAKRGAELMLFQFILPVMALDLLTTNREKWNNFKVELFICIFGYIIQLLSFNIFMMLFSQVMAVDSLALSPKVLFASLAWLMIVLSAPKWIQKFMYTSGIGQAATGGARSAAMIIPQFIRR